MKQEWRKQEKQFYLPGKKPEIIEIPEMKFFVVSGAGNPNDDFFAEYIGVLYSLSYAVRMSHKSGTAPDGYFEYTVYPLEGFWDISDKAKKQNSGVLDKNELVFDLMIRQPDFVQPEFADEIIEKTRKKKPHALLDEVRFETIKEGLCVQMLHAGPYDTEPESFMYMEDFCLESGFRRTDKRHREIYLTDARKTAPEKFRTVLRFKAASV